MGNKYLYYPLLGLNMFGVLKPVWLIFQLFQLYNNVQML
jgi:hypothetical protein